MNNSAIKQFLRENIIQNRSMHYIIQPDGTKMVYTFSPEKLQSTEPDEQLIDKLSPASNCRYIYRWNNGRVGAIFPDENGHLYSFSEYKLYDGKDDNLSFPPGLRPAKEGDEQNNECQELLASGIVAYYLFRRNKMDPKDIFADYLKEEKKSFDFLQSGKMNAWDKKNIMKFSYSQHFKHEKHFIRMSSRLFDFLGTDEVAELNDMTDNYLAYVKSFMPNEVPIITWEMDKKWFKEAMLLLMEKKKSDGDYLFGKNTQWMAVYRWAIDNGIMYEDGGEPEDPDGAQYKIFEDFVHELQLDDATVTRLPFKRNYINAISKGNYARYREQYPWSKEGLENDKSFALYCDLDNAYVELENNFYNLSRNFITKV